MHKQYDNVVVLSPTPPGPGEIREIKNSRDFPEVPEDHGRALAAFANAQLKLDSILSLIKSLKRSELKNSAWNADKVRVFYKEETDALFERAQQYDKNN